MTLPNVKPKSTESPLLAADNPSLQSPTSPAAAALPTIASLTLGGAGAAANEDVAATPDAIRNPLWIIAWGMACLFGVIAAIIALG
jgi:hypothetical protein